MYTSVLFLGHITKLHLINLLRLNIRLLNESFHHFISLNCMLLNIYFTVHFQTYELRIFLLVQRAISFLNP